MQLIFYWQQLQSLEDLSDMIDVEFCLSAHARLGSVNNMELIH